MGLPERLRERFGDACFEYEALVRARAAAAGEDRGPAASLRVVCLSCLRWALCAACLRRRMSAHARTLVSLLCGGVR